MREIKFRSWCGQQKRMFSKVIVGNTSNPKSDDYTAHCIYRDGDWYHVDHHDTDVYFMQFTGLKDKNGVEIYEGDIVSVIDSEMEHDKVTGKVAWYDSYCPAFDIYVKTDRSRTGFESYSDEFNAFTMDVIIKVIGNIHQNPELLED